MKTRSKLLAVSAMLAAVWCTAPYAQSTTTESTTLPGATPQYPPAANSTGVDTPTTAPKKRVRKSSARSVASTSSAPTTMASNNTSRRALPPRRDRH